jgi:hypothetical protein
LRVLTDKDEIQALPFSETQQEAIVGYCLLYPIFFMKCYRMIKATWFTYNPRVSIIFDQLCKFYEKQNRCPRDPSELVDEPFFVEMSMEEQNKYRDLVTRCMVSATKSTDLPRMEKYLTGFIRTCLFKEAISGGANIFKIKGLDEAYQKTKDKLQEIEKATFEDDSMIIPFANPEVWLAEDSVEKSKIISTGSKNLDDILQGGLYPGDTTMIMAPTNTGKCLGKDTLILMFDGSIKKVQDINIGELLMGPDSKPRKVLNTTSGIGKLYEITPHSGGDSWICNDVHVLSLKSCTDQYNYKKNKIVNIPINEYINKSNNFKHLMKLWRAPVNFREQLTDIEPYMMGLWIGDGTFNKPQITNMDPEVIAYVNDWAKRNDLELHSRNSSKFGNPKVKSLNISHISHSKGKNIFLNAIRKARINGEKRIPKNYLLNSKIKRLELLAGIIDTDGYVSKVGVEICTKWKGLSEDIAYLCRSLGFKASVHLRTKTIKSIRFSAQYYVLNINAPLEQIPCKIARKCGKHRLTMRDPTKTKFTVKDIGIGEYYGFELDGDHLFLLGDFTVTHNTTLMLTLARHAAVQGKDVLIIMHEGKQKAIRRQLLAALVGVSKHKLVEMAGLNQAFALKEPAAFLDEKVTYVHYSKALGMYMEDVLAEIKKRNDERRIKVGKGYDMVVVDYPAKQRSRTLSSSHAPRHEELAYIYDQHQLLGGEIGAHMLLAMQTNKEGYSQNKVAEEHSQYLDLDNIGGSFAINNNMPNVISLNRSTQDKSMKLLHLTVLKSRDSQTHVTFHTFTDYDCSLTHGDPEMFARFTSLDSSLRKVGLISKNTMDNSTHPIDTIFATLAHTQQGEEIKVNALETTKQGDTHGS